MPALPPPWPMLLTAGVLVLLVVALAREWARPDLVLMGALGLLLAGGAVGPEAAFAGFSNPAVITIAALFVVAAGVQQTNALAFLDHVLLGRRRPLPVVLARMMGLTAALSAFVNNTPLVAMLVPRVQAWAQREGVPAGKVMMPISYAAVVGGTVTLLGTSTNLVVSGLLEEATGSGLGLFTQTAVGLPAAAVGVAFFAFIGYRLLPAGGGAAWQAEPVLDGYHFELRTGAALAGRMVEEAGLRALGDAFLAHIHRGEHVVGPVAPEEVLQVGDRLAFQGNAAALDRLLARPGLERAVRGFQANGHQRLPLFEAVVAPTSTLVGRTLKEADFRESFGGAVLAIQRADAPITSSLGRVPLRAGDLLLIEARGGFAQRWGADRQTFSLVASRAGALPLPRTKKAPLALALFGAMVALSALGLVPLVTAAFVTALAMVATRCLRVSEARLALDLPVLLMIAAAFGIGAAVEGTGLAAALAHPLVRAAAPLGPFAILTAVYALTNGLTELLTNSAAAALMLPLALATAADLGASPVPFAVAVAVAASAGFATPFGYQTHLMVMGAGGYRFADFLRAGLPMNVVVGAVALAAIWLIWF